MLAALFLILAAGIGSGLSTNAVDVPAIAPVRAPDDSEATFSGGRPQRKAPANPACPAQCPEGRRFRRNALMATPVGRRVVASFSSVPQEGHQVAALRSRSFTDRR
jgi:hypothetical protein